MVDPAHAAYLCLPMSHDKDVGYKPYASLFIDSETRDPIASIGLELKNSKGTLQWDQT